MHAHPGGGGELAVDRLAQQRVREAEAPEAIGHVGEHARANRLVERVEQRLGVDVGGARERRHLELAHDHRGVDERFAAFVGERPQTAADHVAPGGGDAVG